MLIKGGVDVDEVNLYFGIVFVKLGDKVGVKVVFDVVKGVLCNVVVDLWLIWLVVLVV